MNFILGLLVAQAPEIDLFEGGEIDFSQGGGEVNPVALLIPLTIVFLLALVMIVAMWKIFTKAGHPGWASIIPIYNLIILLQIVQRPIWWIILFFIPFVSLIIAIIIALDLAQSFGKGAGFGLGLIFLPIIFYPILGFGDAVYSPKKAEA